MTNPFPWVIINDIKVNLVIMCGLKTLPHTSFDEYIRDLSDEDCDVVECLLSLTFNI